VTLLDDLDTDPMQQRVAATFEDEFSDLTGS
jgi:hypothetical protein